MKYIRVNSGMGLATLRSRLEQLLKDSTFQKEYYTKLLKFLNVLTLVREDDETLYFAVNFKALQFLQFAADYKLNPEVIQIVSRKTK